MSLLCERLQSRTGIITKPNQPQFIFTVRSTTQKSQNDDLILEYKMVSETFGMARIGSYFNAILEEAQIKDDQRRSKMKSYQRVYDQFGISSTESMVNNHS